MTFGYQIGQQTSRNIDEGFRRSQDARAMDEILSAAARDGGSEGVQQTITQMLAQASPQSQQNILSMLDRVTKEKQLNQQNQFLKQQGINPNAPEWIQKEQFKNQSGNDSEAEKKYQNLRAENISEYVNEAFNKGKEAEELRSDIFEAEQAIKSGNIEGPGFKATLKTNPYTQLIMGLTPEEAVLQAANKKFLGGTKGIFGSKPTEREIFLLLNSMLPSIGKTQETNMVGLRFIQRMNDMALMHADIVDQLTQSGTKFVPNLEAAVNKLMQPYGEQLRKEMIQAKTELEKNETNRTKNKEQKKAPEGTQKYKSPDGKIFYATPEQVALAAEAGEKYELVK